VVGSQTALADGQGAVVQAAGTIGVALVVQDAGKVVEAAGSNGVVGAEAGLWMARGTLMKATGAVQVALAAQDAREAVEAEGGVGVVGARSVAPSPVRMRATWSARFACPPDRTWGASSWPGRRPDPGPMTFANPPRLYDVTTR
jgi:hypothetical protein